MVFAVDIMYGYGLSNKMRLRLLSKKTLYVLAGNIRSSNGRYLHCTLLIRYGQKHFSFRSGCVIRVAKCLKENWFIMLR